MSICDWFSKWRYDRALKRGTDALDRSADGWEQVRDRLAHAAARARNIEIRAQLDAMPIAKPDTVESVLNQFIALGYDKPEVVIKGAVRHDGSERYEATIDGEKVLRRGMYVWLEHFDSLAGAEEVIAGRLKLMLGGTNVEEIEITY